MKIPIRIRFRLRIPVLCLLFVTVVSPILLHTDKLVHDELTETEDISTFALTARTSQLNVLPQENAMFVKEPVGKVLEAQHVEVEHKTRVLSTTTTISATDTADLENPIKQVTDGNGLGVHVLSMPGNHAAPDLKDSTAHLTSTNVDITPELQSVEKGGSVGTKETVSPRHKSEKSINQVGTVSNTPVRHLKDQLIRAKVYLSLTATRNNAHFIRELRQRIKEVQRTLADATKDSDLPRKYIFLFSWTRCGEFYSDSTFFSL